ncbi:hypothetical protein V5O48_012350 [Marasmius crinis-equi]|uniref:Major facilitator superfamily (MFS) profile domain-containing protein n=1 Tax=Marasmius crinis-equi TaxID=585013 RepID=A0ABR3F327_9AGAR
MPKPPVGLNWRAGAWYITFVVWLGITVDFLVYSIIVPVVPFQLQKLGYANASSLAGWLLFSFYAGSVLATFPIAMVSERYNSRKGPLIIGVIVFITAIVMLMIAPVYWLMVLARILQGVGAAMNFIPGLALLCDTVAEKSVGSPPVGGVLFRNYGFRGACLFGIIASVVSLIARLIVVERKHALSWGFDPQGGSVDVDPGATNERPLASSGTVQGQIEPLETKKHLSLFSVVIRLLKSRRTCATIFCVFLSAILNTAPEPPVPIHANKLWGLDSAKVGLLFIAAVVPGLFSTPLSGFLADKFGIAPVAFAGLLLSTPFWVILTTKTLPLFVMMYATIIFFTSGSYAPLNSELANVARAEEGIGYAHVYGAFNIAYGLGGAVGPILGGQIYDRVANGWNALCYVSVGLVILSAMVAFFGVGEETLAAKVASRVRRPRRRPREGESYLDMGGSRAAVEKRMSA